MLTEGSVRTLSTLALIFAALYGCGRRASEPAPALLIDDVTIVDGRASTPRAGMSVLVEGETIAAIGPSGSLAPGPRIERLDGSGRYLVPGLWDMHTHALWEPFFSDGYLSLFVANGVTGIRDMGGEMDVLTRLGSSRSDLVLPHIVASGPALDLEAPDPRAMTRVETPEQARTWVARLARAGADFVKVYLTLPEPAFVAAIEAAHDQGLAVAGHVPLGVDTARAARLGMRSIEHMQAEIGGYCDPSVDGDCEPLFELFRRLPCWQTPTLSIRRNRARLDDPEVVAAPWLRWAPAYLLEEWSAIRHSRLTAPDAADVERRYEDELRLAAALVDAEVPLLAGSDAGDLYSLAGFGLHDELALLVEVGLSTRRALQIATLGAAEYLGEEHLFGTIEAGRRADLLVVERNPLEDLDTLRRPLVVVLAGRVFGRTELDALVAGLPRDAKPQSGAMLE